MSSRLLKTTIRARSAKRCRPSKPGGKAMPCDPIETLVKIFGEFSLELDSSSIIRAIWSAQALQESRDRPALLGKRLSEVIGARAFAPCARLFRQVLKSGRMEAFECPAELSDGKHWFHIRVLPVRREKKSPPSLWISARDYTERMQAAEKLKKSEALLAEARQLARLGSWEFDIKTKTPTWSKELCVLLGLDPLRTPPTEALYWQLVHPDDRQQLRRKKEDALARRGPYEHTTRYLLSNGETRMLLTRGKPILDEGGEVVRLVGIVQDVTGQWQEAERLEKSEALLAQTERIANIGSWEYDVERKTFQVSDNMFRLLGFEPAAGELDLKDVCAIFHPDDRERTRGDAQAIAAESRSLENEVRFVLPDGRVRLIQTRAVPILDESNRVVRIGGMSRDITDHRAAELEHRELARRLLNLQDEERRRVARGLHETAAQSLAALKMTLAKLGESYLEKNASLPQLVESSLSLAEEAIREVRTVSYLMHPPMLDEQGLGPALRWYAKGFSDRSGIQVETKIAPDFGRLPDEAELAIFRIVQEALTNVHRHSGSPSAEIRLSRAGGSARVEVEDFGAGMMNPPSDAPWKTGMGVGIAGMQERVSQLNGRLQILSVTGKGTTIIVSLPLEEKKLAS